MFAREDEKGDLNCHQMQTMWYEDHQGRAYYRQGNYRLALKNFCWIRHHLFTIAEDCEDFSSYSFRKGSYNQYLQLLNYQKKINTGKWPEAGCIDALRTLSKIRKAAAQPEKLTEMKKGEEEYLASDVYKKLEEELKKDGIDEDDIHKNDKDPEGWRAYVRAAEGQDELCFAWATTAVAQVASNPMLSAKCLQLCIAYDKPAEAVKAALSFANATESSPGLHKVARALAAFKTYAASKPEI